MAPRPDPRREVPVMTVQERAADPAVLLAQLRAEYTPAGWAFLHDPGRGEWFALHRMLARPLVFTSPIALRSAVDASPTQGDGRRRA